MSGGQRMLAIDERSVNAAAPTDLDAPLMTRVQRLLRRQDLAAGRATASFLPRGEASLTSWERIMGAKLPDPRVHGGVTHTAEVSMRMRKRTWQYMSSWIRCDQTLHSIWDPLWRKTPVGLKPCASNPAAMWRSFPRFEDAVAAIDDNLPTHGCPTAQRWRNWQVGHMWHCDRCRHYSAQLHGAPPSDELYGAMEDGWVDPGGWSLDPDCYQRLQIHYIRTGFEPPLDPAVPLPRGLHPNPKLVFDEWAGTTKYLTKLDSFSFNVLTEGRFTPPPITSPILPVIRPADMAKHIATGEPYKVRPCWNGKTSRANSVFLPWRFAFAGVNAAVRLLEEDGCAWNPVRQLEASWGLRPPQVSRSAAVAPEPAAEESVPEAAAGECGVWRPLSLLLNSTDLNDDDLIWLFVQDLTAYYLYLALGERTSRLTWISDPRRESQWKGSGAPPADWAARHGPGGKPGYRCGRYRRFLTIPFGLQPAVAYSSAISGEMSHMIVAWGIPNNYFIDGDLGAVRGKRRALRAKDFCKRLAEWLGFAVSPKSEGPCRILKYLGVIIDLERRELRADPRAVAALLETLQGVLTAGSVNAKELQRICGRMNWVAYVMYGAATFIRNLYTLLGTSESDEQVLRLDEPAKRHVTWWISHLSDPTWKGSRLIPRRLQTPVVTFKSDASGGGAMMYGYVYNGVLHWCTPDEGALGVTHIQFRELMPIVHAAAEYGVTWSNCIVRVGCDNVSDCYAINRHSSPDPALQLLLEELAELQELYSFLLCASHVDRRFNWLADMCTRWSCLQDFEAGLPHGVSVPLELCARVCRARCPGSGSVVYSLPLKLS